MVPSWFQEGVVPMMVAPFGGFLGPLGVPKIDQKSIIGLKWRPQGSLFIDFWGIPHCHQLFHRFFLDFLPNNRCFFWCVFVALLLFFSTWRPSRYIVIYRSKWSFSFFQFLIFFWKNDQKSSQKNTSKNITQNDHLGTPLGPQNGYELKNKNPKITQMPPKHIFLRVPFFDVFLGC